MALNDKYDDTIPSPNEVEQFLFYDSKRVKEELWIRLKYDKMSLSQLMRYFVRAYLNLDPRIMEIVKETKEKLKIDSKLKREETQRLVEETFEMRKDFSLSEEELKDIFDITEKAHPDL